MVTENGWWFKLDGAIVGDKAAAARDLDRSWDDYGSFMNRRANADAIEIRRFERELVTNGLRRQRARMPRLPSPPIAKARGRAPRARRSAARRRVARAASSRSSPSPEPPPPSPASSRDAWRRS